MATIAFGQAVEANYQGKGKWHKGQIMGIRDDGTFDLLYEDGDGESEVPRDRIRLPGEGDGAGGGADGAAPEGGGGEGGGGAAGEEAGKIGKTAVQIGSTVEIRTGSARQGNVAWKKATITGYEAELQAYDLEVEGGGVEKGVPGGMLRIPGAAAAGKDGGSKSGGRSARRNKSKLMNAISELTAQVRVGWVCVGGCEGERGCKKGQSCKRG